MANADRNHSAYLYQFGETMLLVDCGEPVSRAYRATGHPAEAVDGVLLTHLHSDHFGGLFMLLQGFWLEERRKPLPIHLPSDGIQPISRLMEVANLVPELIRFPVAMEAWKAGQAISQGNVRVTPYPTSHMDGLREQFQGKYPGRYEAFCLLFEHEGRRVAHTADLGAPEDLAPLVSRPLDLLVCELSHFSIEEICGYLRGRAIKKLVFTHLARKYWEDFEGTSKAVKSLLPAMDARFAWDGDVITL